MGWVLPNGLPCSWRATANCSGPWSEPDRRQGSLVRPSRRRWTRTRRQPQNRNLSQLHQVNRLHQVEGDDLHRLLPHHMVLDNHMVLDYNKVLNNLKMMQNLATVTIMLKYLKKILMEARNGMAVDGMTVGQLRSGETGLGERMKTQVPSLMRLHGTSWNKKLVKSCRTRFWDGCFFAELDFPLRRDSQCKPRPRTP